MKKICCCLLAFLLLSAPAWALTVLSPDDDFYVLDDAGVLSRDTISHIIFNNDDLYEACGAQIVFVTLDSTRSNDIDIADYVYTLFNQWGVGDGKKNNGIVVLLAIEDDDYYYMQGTGLERSLPSGEMSELADKWLEPSFAEKDYDRGCRLFFDALFERVASIYKVNLSPKDYPASLTAPRESVIRRGGGSGSGAAARRTSDPDDDDDSGLTILLAVLIVLAVLFFVGRNRGGCGCLPSFLGGFLGGRIGRYGSSSHSRPSYGPTRRRPPSSSGPFGGFGGGRSGGGGTTRGSGGGRSSGSFGSGRSSGSFGGGRSGGGGSTRGGGGGRGR